MAAKLGTILLAAGASQRMGQSKQLLPVQGEPAIRFCIRQILDAGLETLVVVLGANRKEILPVLGDLPVGIAVNTRSGSQMAESVSCGLSEMPHSVTGIMIALCDHPLVSFMTYATLSAHYYQAPDSILLPVYNGRGGHPTVFPRFLCNAVHANIPLNRVVRRHADRVCRIPVDDPAVILDMDTPDDYQCVLSLAAERIPADTD